MELSPTLKRNLLLVATGIGFVGLTGCGDNITTKNRNVGEYGNNSYDYPRSNTNRKIHAECEGTTLFVKTIDNGGYDDERYFNQDPACADQVLDKEDDITSAVAEASTGFDNF